MCFIKGHRLLVFIFLITFYGTGAQIIHVPADYPTIQQAIEASGPGDTVLVEPGTYYEVLYINNKAITIASNYILTQDNSFISATVIDGNHMSRTVTIVYGDSTTVLCGFTIRNGSGNDYGGGIIYENFAYEGNHIYTEDPVTIFLDTFNVLIPYEFHAFPAELFTFDIIYGKKQQVSEDVFVSPSGDNANSGLNEYEPFRTIHHAYSVILPNVENRHVIRLLEGTYSFSHNGEFFPVNMMDYVNLEAELDKKAVLDAENQSNVIRAFDLNSASINGLVLIHGYSAYGGGIYCFKSNLQVLNTIIKDNRCEAHGGGISSSAYSILDLVNVLITGNIAEGSNGNGGAIAASLGFLSITNGTICNNSGVWGGGIRLDMTNLTINNSIVWDNSPGGITGGSEMTEIVIRYSDIQEEWEGIGNISSNPLFVIEGENPYELSEGSPCIDAGTPDNPHLHFPDYDILGNYRVWDGNSDGLLAIDMGAYEYGSVGVGITDQKAFDRDAGICCYPNPSQGTFIFKYELQDLTRVRLSVFNSLGAEVSIITDEYQEKGMKHARWDTKGCPAGIYFYKMSFSGVPQTVTGKIVLAR